MRQNQSWSELPELVGYLSLGTGIGFAVGLLISLAIYFDPVNSAAFGFAVGVFLYVKVYEKRQDSSAAVFHGSAMDKLRAGGRPMAKTLAVGQVVIGDEERRERGDVGAFEDASRTLLDAYEQTARGLGKGAKFTLTLTVEQHASEDA